MSTLLIGFSVPVLLVRQQNFKKGRKLTIPEIIKLANFTPVFIKDTYGLRVGTVEWYGWNAFFVNVAGGKDGHVCISEEMKEEIFEALPKRSK